MENQFVIEAENRTDVGQGASRRLRRAGLLPAVIYGAHKEAKSITVNANTIKHQLDYEGFYSHILTLKLDGQEEKVVLKDLQRHPVKGLAMHVDFQRVDAKEELTMHVPLHFLNEEKCKGVRLGGGVLTHIYNDLEISCLPDFLPEYIEVDVLDLEIGDAIHLEDVKLPEGVVIYALKHGGDGTQPVVTVQAPRVEEVDDEAEEEPEAPVATSQKTDEEKDDD